MASPLQTVLTASSVAGFTMQLLWPVAASCPSIDAWTSHQCGSVLYCQDMRVAIASVRAHGISLRAWAQSCLAVHVWPHNSAAYVFKTQRIAALSFASFLSSPTQRLLLSRLPLEASSAPSIRSSPTDLQTSLTVASLRNSSGCMTTVI